MADTEQVLNLAAIIREVDGGNNKGAAALAESILDHPRFRAALADEPAVPDGREPASVAMQLTEPGAEGPSAEALANFTAWFCRNYPGPDTLIHRPEWHAPKVFRAAAAAIARWGHRPAPPSEEEVAELVQHLHHAAEVDDWNGASPEWCQSMLRAADLLQRLSPLQPLPGQEVSE